MPKKILFTLTGWFIYSVFSFPFVMLVESRCPMSEHVSATEPCVWIFVVLIIVAVAGFRSAMRAFYRAGRWAWSLILPEFAAA
jgi:hypothetical protein